MEGDFMNVAVFLAPGFEEIEALTVVDYLRRANQNTVVVAVPTDGLSDCEPVVEGAHQIKVVADISLKNYIEKLNGAEPDAIFFPGGSNGAKNLSDNQFLFQLATKMERKGKIVSAICAAPAVVLAPTGILSGRKWTGYPGLEKELDKICGSAVAVDELMENSTYIPNVPFVLDNNVLTGRGPGTTEQFAMKLVELTAGSEVAEQIKKGSLQR